MIGGASIVTFPVLLATGIPPVTAIVSNTVALVPGNLLAALYDRAQMPPLGRSFARWLLSQSSGAMLGAVLLLLTPERVFAVLVPLLLGFATVLFGYAPRIAAWLRTRSQGGRGGKACIAGRAASPRLFRSRSTAAILEPASACWCSACSRSAPVGDYRSANVAKNLVVCFNSLGASIFFAARGSVAWPQALTMMAGALVGAVIGARIAQVLPNDVARGMVVVLGAVLTFVYAWRYWF